MAPFVEVRARAVGRRRTGTSVEPSVVIVQTEPSRVVTLKPLSVSSLTVPLTLGTTTAIAVTV